MSTDRQDIDLALATLESINESMACGRIGATSRLAEGGGTEWKLDPRVEELSWVAKWWRDYRDEDVPTDDLIPRGPARRTVERVVTGLLLAVEQLGREHRNEAARLEERITTLLDLIELRGKLQIRKGINGTVNWWLVVGAMIVVGLAIGIRGKGTIVQSLPLLVPGFALVVVVKVVLLNWPIRRWRSRIAEMERAMPGSD